MLGGSLNCLTTSASRLSQRASGGNAGPAAAPALFATHTSTGPSRPEGLSRPSRTFESPLSSFNSTVFSPARTASVISKRYGAHIRTPSCLQLTKASAMSRVRETRRK